MNYDLVNSRLFEEWKSTLLLYKFGVDEITTKLNIINEEYSYIHTYNPIDHIESRVKTPKKIKEKLLRRGYEPTLENARKYLTDIGGVRVVCSFVNDIYTVLDIISFQTDIKVIEIEDYIKNPKPNGYRSLHALVEVPIFLSRGMEKVIIEIQIRTIAMDFWASLEHKIHYHEDINSQTIKDKLAHCSQLAADLDLKMLEIKDEIITLKAERKANI